MVIMQDTLSQSPWHKISTANLFLFKLAGWGRYVLHSSRAHKKKQKMQVHPEENSNNRSCRSPQVQIQKHGSLSIHNGRNSKRVGIRDPVPCGL